LRLKHRTALVVRHEDVGSSASITAHDAAAPPYHAWTVCLAAAAGALTASFRFLATPGFNNDHFVHLTAAQQMLFGDWPTRDFIDIGRPLTIITSAIGQQVLGRTLFAEAVLVSIAFGIAAALTAVIVRDVTGSLGAAAGAVLFEVAAFPRTYSYPKIMITAAGLAVVSWFVRNPSRMRQFTLAVMTAIAFLFRHDLGLFIGAGGLAASLVAEPAAAWRARVRSAAAFLFIACLIVAPYLLYVQLTDGLWNYFATTLDANRAEAGYVWPNPFASDAPAEARLLYLFHLVPLAAAALCLIDWRRDRRGWQVRFLVSVAVVAVAENFGLMRDLLSARVPDAVVPVTVLGAWLAWRGWTAHASYVAMAAAIAVGGTALLVADLGSLADNVERVGLAPGDLLRPPRVIARFAARSAMLRDRFASDPPSRVVMPLRPFFSYVDRCTTEHHRIFVAGMIPEVPYYARRAFAGGGYEHYNYRSEVNQRRVVGRLEREVVPFALIPSEAAEELWNDLPIVSAYFRSRYVPLAEIPIYQDRSVQIMVDRTLRSTHVDAATGWPCFT
jgi:hypothetical protein